MRLGGFLVLCCLMLALPASAQKIYGEASEDRNLDDIKASGFIEIGVYRNFPPYSFESEDGTAQGVDIEVGKIIAKGLGVEPKWFWITPDETLEDDLRNNVWKGSMLDRSVADLMLRVPYDREYAYARDGYGLPKHDNVVMFGPYHAEAWTMARDLEKTGEVRNLAIFRFEKVGVEIASLPDTILVGAYNGQLRNNVVHYATTLTAIDGLRAGEVAGVVGMRSQIEYSLRDIPNQFDVDDDGLHEVARLSWDIGAAVKQNHRELAYAVEDVIARAYQSGELASAFEQFSVSYVKPSVWEDDEED